MNVRSRGRRAQPERRLVSLIVSAEVPGLGSVRPFDFDRARPRTSYRDPHDLQPVPPRYSPFGVRSSIARSVAPRAAQEDKTRDGARRHRQPPCDVSATLERRRRRVRGLITDEARNSHVGSPRVSCPARPPAARRRNERNPEEACLRKLHSALPMVRPPRDSTRTLSPSMGPVNPSPSGGVSSFPDTIPA